MRKLLKSYNRWQDNHLTLDLLKSIKPVDINKAQYIFILNPVHSKFAQKLYTLVSHELSTHAIPSCLLYKNDLWSPYYPKLYVDGHEITNSLDLVEKRFIKLVNGHELFFDWKVEIKNERIETEGINFFPFIRNTLRMIQKRYNVFFTDDNNNPTYSALIQSCDILLHYFFLLKSYSKKHNIKIRFVGWEISYIPNGIFKFLCDRLSHNRDVEFIELERGYIIYFGQHHLRESYITYSNLTKAKLPFGLVISRDELAGIAEEKIDLDKLYKPLSNAVGKEIYSEIPVNQERVVQTIQDYKARGRKVFVLFSHLFYDTPVDDESPSFNGMGDWIKETVKYFSGKEDLLLIKPHPSELRKDLPKKAPNETVASFLRDTTLSKNIIILEPRLFAVKDLSPFISCGLIWRSSVALELTFLGIPCIIAGKPYYTELDFSLASDKEDYFRMIKQSHEIQATDKQRIDVARYVYLLESKHVHVDCISYNTTLRKFYWNRKALRNFLKNGNKNIKSLVENILQ
jgi:capsular polysaccharide export protein